jgi:signal transduction histidine kinase/CheY-like chemotaxis protein
MQGQRDLHALCTMLMSEITEVVQAQQGAFFLLDVDDDQSSLRLASGYGIPAQDLRFRLGESLVGQAAAQRRRIRVPATPEGYLTVRSGLGAASPSDVIVLPVLFEDQVLGVIELGAFVPYGEQQLDFLDQLVETIGVVLNTIIANTRTEELLAQSQRLTQELQVQSDELQRTNAELQDKAQLLTQQSQDLEAKNREIELARLGVEEKAEQLQLASQYKSEFLANMSHELRTPLNSLLILAKLLADNPETNLTDRQIEFARTIHRAGSDLLELINDILDLSKIEAGKMDVHSGPLDIRALCADMQRSFAPVAEQQGLDFEVTVDEDLPPRVVTDEQRIRQVVKNLLANAFKFTDAGRVSLHASLVSQPDELRIPELASYDQVVAIAVSDTGIGVSVDKLKLIFEAFQQADGTTSRKYGGTGLGLSISREIARLIGGAITVRSASGQGSTFTLYVPLEQPSGEGPLTAIAPETAVNGPILAAPRAASMPTVSAQRDLLAGATVLVVDDDIRNVFALTSALELQGVHVRYADNGADGIRQVELHPEIDLVLMDVMMPDMDGNETTAVIRAMPDRGSLPVLFLTARATAGDREKSFAAGATDYFTKPVDLDQLLDAMIRWLHKAPAADDRMADGA